MENTAATAADTAQPLMTEESHPHTDHALHLSQVESLTNELKRLLVMHEATLDQEGIREQIETLERWAESYRRGLKAASKISEKGPTWLNELKDRFKLAADELQRLEAEGGNPLTREQAARADELLKASHHIDEVIPSVENITNHQFEMETVA